MDFNIKYSHSGINIFILSAESKEILVEVTHIIDSAFPGDFSEFADLCKDAYFTMVLDAQERINRLNIIERLVDAEREYLCTVLGGHDITAQRIAYLRAIRSRLGARDETVGFHRESFFNADLRHAQNVWIPIRGVEDASAIQFVPGSQSIPEDQIKAVNHGEGSGQARRYSAGHKIGLLYDREEIVSGVEFSRVEALNVPNGSYTVFDSNLIHGAGVNRTNEIRFSLDFRIIRQSNIVRDQDSFATSGRFFGAVS